jgi:hypothetical protein
MLTLLRQQLSVAIWYVAMLWALFVFLPHEEIEAVAKGNESAIADATMKTYTGVSKWNLRHTNRLYRN